MQPEQVISGKCNEILWPRILRAVYLSVLGCFLSEVFCLCCVVYVTHFSNHLSDVFLSPLTALVSSLATFRQRFWSLLGVQVLALMLISCFVVFTGFVSNEIRQRLYVSSNILRYVQLVVSPKVMLWVAWNFIFGLTMTWNFLFLGSIDSTLLTKNYLSVQFITLLLVGLFSSLFSLARYQWSLERRSNSISNASLMLTFDLWHNLFGQLFRDALKCTFVCAFLCILFGHTLVTKTASFSGGLPEYIVLAFFTSLVILSAYWVCHASLSLTLNEAHSFPIPSMTKVNEANELYLQLALNSENRLLKQLAFHDLLCSAKFSYERRHMVFAISHPGGHPRNWNDFSACCSGLIAMLNLQLMEAGFSICCKSYRRLFSAPTPNPTTILNVKHTAATCERQNDVPSLNVSRLCPGSESKAASLAYFTSAIAQYLPPCLERLRRSSCNYSAECAMWYLKNNADIHFSNIEAISYLLTASLKEDTYGVVQKDFASLLGGLLNLHANFERFCRLSSGHYPPRPSAKQSEALKLQFHLCLSSSIARIVCALGSRIRDVPMEPQQTCLLEKYKTNSY